MEGWADLDEGQRGLGICSLATVPKSTQSMGSSNPPPRLSPRPPPRHYHFSRPVPRPYLPGVQLVLRARSAPCNPSRLPWPQHNARISDSSFKVCFRLPPPPPLLPPTPSIILPTSGPQYPPSPVISQGDLLLLLPQLCSSSPRPWFTLFHQRSVLPRPHSPSSPPCLSFRPHSSHDPHTIPSAST